MIRTVFFKKALVLLFVLGASLGLLRAVDEAIDVDQEQACDSTFSADVQGEKISATADESTVQDSDQSNALLDDEQQEKVSMTSDITFESNVISDDTDLPSADEALEPQKEKVSATSSSKKIDEDDMDEEKIIDEDDENISISGDHDFSLDVDLEEF